MGICFIFVIFGLSVSAKEEDLQGYPSMKIEITTFRTTMPTEEQNGSAGNGVKASTELPAHLTRAVWSSPGTDLFQATTPTEENAITQNDVSFVSTYGTDLLFLSKDSTAEKKLQSDGDLLLISNDEGGIHPSAEAEFKSMINDTMTPSAHLSRGREKIPALLHAPLKSKNKTVLDSITFSSANGIPVVSASDPAVIYNLWESTESMESQSKNKSENWTLVLFRTKQKPIQTDEAPLNKIHSTIIHFTQDTELLTAVSAPDFKNPQYPRRRFEGELKEQKNQHFQNSVILKTPMQVKPTSRVLVNLMTKSNRNPSTKEPKPILGVLINGPETQHPNSMFLFSASKVTPTKTPDSTTLNYFSNIVTAAGEMHVTKQFASLPKIAPARDSLESKLISHIESSKKHHIKQTSFFQNSTTSFFHRLNESDVRPHKDIFSNAQNSSSSDGHLLQTTTLCTNASIEAGTCNMSAIEINYRTDDSSVLLSKLIAFTTASFTSAEEASMTGDKRNLMKHPQHSCTAPPTLLTRADTSKLPDQFEILSIGFPLTNPPNAFHVSKQNNHSPIRKSQTRLPSKTPSLFTSNPPDRRPARATNEPSQRAWTRSSFMSTNVRRFRNNPNVTKFYSKNQKVSCKVASVISERPNVTTTFTRHEPISPTKPFVTSLFTVPLVPLTPPNSNVSRTSITFARTAETSITPLSLELQVSVTDRLLSSNAVSPKKTSPILTPFRKSHNIVTTDDTVLLKLSDISKNSNNENIFLNHSLTTESIISPLAGRQGPKKPKGTEMFFSIHYTLRSIPSVRQQVEYHSGETSLTATPQLQSKVQIESYLKKIHSTVKPTTLQHIHQSDSPVVNHTSPKSILHKNVSQNLMPINSTSVFPVVYSTAKFKHHSTFSALLEISASAEQVLTQSVPQFKVKPITPAMLSGKDNRKDSFSSHQAFANSTDVQEHPQNVAAGQNSGITEFLNRPKRKTAATRIAVLNTSPSSESPAGRTLPTLPLFLSPMPENHTEFFTIVYERSTMAQSSVPSYELTSSGTTENPKLLGRTAQSAFTWEKSDIYYTDEGSSSTQMFPKGPLQPSGGSKDVSRGVTPYDKSDSVEKSTKYVSDMPVISRRKRIISPDSLSGLAQISDDICGTGNYTAEMSLNLERDIMPGDLIPALGNLRVVINLKTNNSHVDLEIKSCCLSPTVRLDEFNTTCCSFPRLPVDHHGTRPLPSVPSKMATFTIRLFQMINYSTAYLHCDLSVCLRNHSECERQCVERRNARRAEGAGAVFRSAGNRISFGPILKGIDNSSLSEAAADTETAVVIMSSVAGCLLACLALLLVWMAHRRCLERSACCWSGAHCKC